MNWQQSLKGFPLPHGQIPVVSKYATLCTSVADLALYNETLLHGKGYLGDGRTCATCWDRWRGADVRFLNTVVHLQPTLGQSIFDLNVLPANRLYWHVVADYYLHLTLIPLQEHGLL